MAAKKKPSPKATAKGEPRMAEDTIERTIDMGTTEVDGGYAGDDTTAEEEKIEMHGDKDAESTAEPETAHAESAQPAGEKVEQEKYLRLMAEFQNYKRRTENEKEDIRKYASERLVLQLIEVMDGFDRALVQAENSTDTAFVSGMSLIFKQLSEVMTANGVEEIAALGSDFDPNFHNAVMMEDTDEYESGHVSAVLQKGYTLNGKVVRPAMVKVAN